jgi:hypothetical protein
MLPKFFACWLAVLIIVPFTAPFSTCDLAAAQGQHAPFAPPTRTVRNDAASPTVPCISTAGRVRLLRLLAHPLVQTNISSSAARFVSLRASAGFITEQLSLTAILRL